MKWIKLVFYVIVVVLTLLQFKGLEDYLNNTAVSWSFAKIAPYLTLLIGGILIAFWFKKNVILNSKVLKNILFVLILVTPFAIGFAFNNIYEGDFAKNGRVLQKEIKYEDFFNADLVVITIPDCPYCHGSIPSLKLLQKRNPNLRIRMIVCSSDPKQLKPYKKEIGNSFDLQLATNPDSLATVANFAFPSFVMVKNNIPYEVWSNDQFGVRAKDVVEKYFKH